MSNVINIPNPPENSDIQEQAREWIVRLDGEQVSAAELAELHSWTNRSPLHRQALEQAAAAWNAMDSLAALLDPPATAASVDALLTQTTGYAGKPVAAAAATSAGDSTRRTRLFSRTRVSLAALVVLIVAALAYRLLPEMRPADVPTARYATAVGEIKTLTLSDGSEVRLNTNSAVRVAFPGKSRVIQLEGEAYFKVAPDPQRPFVVYAGRFSVKALGTAFAVHALENGVDLTVTAGHVELTSFREPPVDVLKSGAAPTDQAETRVSLLKGQHAHFHGDSKIIESLDTQALEERLSWRDGMLIFDNEPLSDIVAELNRYSTTRIVISEPAIRDLRLGGYFKVQDIGSILDTLRGYGLRVEPVNDKLIYLSRMN
jgi:transmembrane sensor